MRNSLDRAVTDAVYINRVAKAACEAGLRGSPGPEVTEYTNVAAAVAHGIGAAVRKELDAAGISIPAPVTTKGVEVSWHMPSPPPLRRIEIPRHVEEMSVEGWRN